MSRRTPPRIYGKAPADFEELEARVEALNRRINQDYWDLRDRHVDVLTAVTVICARYQLEPQRACSILGLAENFCENHFSFGGASA